MLSTFSLELSILIISSLNSWPNNSNIPDTSQSGSDAYSVSLYCGILCGVFALYILLLKANHDMDKRTKVWWPLIMSWEGVGERQCSIGL